MDDAVLPVKVMPLWRLVCLPGEKPTTRLPRQFRAWTKGEARGLLKRMLGGPLPAGTILVRQG